MNRILALLLLASSVVLAKPLSAPFTHDGLFANAAVGLGNAYFENANGEDFLTADGLGAKLHGKLGYYVVRNFALHVNLNYVMYSNFRESRNDVALYLDHEFCVLSSLYLGAGATYYVPGWHDVFFSGSLGVTGYATHNRRFKGNTGLRAFSFDVEVGKDWWVNEHLTLGASISFDSGEYWSDDDGVFRSSAIMLMFSFTLH